MIKILIVDDQVRIVRMLTRRLKRMYEVHSAGNGKDGVDLAMMITPDLILMDMHMPIMDGRAATKLLRENNYSGLIVALTASAMMPDKQKAIDMGCNDIIRKPIDDTFEDRIKKILDLVRDS